MMVRGRIEPKVLKWKMGDGRWGCVREEDRDLSCFFLIDDEDEDEDEDDGIEIRREK